MEERKNINIWDQDLKKNAGGFQVPGNYFNNVEADILTKINTIPKASKNKVISLKSWVIYGLSIAASMMIFLLVWQNHENSTSFSDWTELEWDQVAIFEESWILEELGDEVEDISYEEIDFLLAQGVTNEEILEVFMETINLEE